MSSPNTIAKCSLLSILFSYKCRKISGPCVVGIRALAKHLTCGKLSGKPLLLRIDCVIAGGGCGVVTGKLFVDGFGVTMGILLTSKSGDVESVGGVRIPWLLVLAADGCGCFIDVI